MIQQFLQQVQQLQDRVREQEERFWHQIAELPRLTAVVTEFQGPYRTCTQCGHLNHEVLPDAIKSFGLGDRLAATLAYLSGCQHLSKRATVEVVATVFGVPFALGSIAALEKQTKQQCVCCVARCCGGSEALGARVKKDADLWNGC